MAVAFINGKAVDSATAAASGLFSQQQIQSLSSNPISYSSGSSSSSSSSSQPWTGYLKGAAPTQQVRDYAVSKGISADQAAYELAQQGTQNQQQNQQGTQSPTFSSTAQRLLDELGVTYGQTKSAAPSTLDTMGLQAAYERYFNNNYTNDSQKQTDLNNLRTALRNGWWTPTDPSGNQGTQGTQTNQLSSAELNARIDAMLANYPNLDAAQKALIKSFATQYEGGLTDTAEIMATFKKMEQESISPYEQYLLKDAQKTVAFAKGDYEGARKLELEQEALTKGTNIRDMQAALEAAGMTSSGKAIEELGGRSAYGQNKNDQTNIPGQQPVDNAKEGMVVNNGFYEGNVNTKNRLMSSGNLARYDANMRDLARKYEAEVGSELASQLFGNSNLTGNLSYANSSAGSKINTLKANTLTSIVDQYKSKRKLLTNQ